MKRARFVQTLIGLLIAILAPIQILALPGLAAATAESAPEFAHLRWPLLILAEFMLLVADLTLVALAKLVGMAMRGTVFSGRALLWVNVIIAALWVGTAAVLPWLAVLGWVTHGPPGATFIALAAVIAGTAAALIVTVMKSLLIRATAQADELAEIV
ncbi:MAG: DUF2975 domain-containing protein [Bifidobacteriaceae bacterium]|jgi:hypothetical protein|nr:DUF2975 domain-containing protein [Bifidobacteriaceae bacterium]